MPEADLIRPPASTLMLVPSAQDMLEQLRPDMRRFESFEEACDAVAALEAASAAALAANGGLAPIDEDDSEEEPESEFGGVAMSSGLCRHKG